MYWDTAINQVVPTPHGFQKWEKLESVRTILRCTDDWLRELTETGLPTWRGHFDAFDIMNLGLYSGSRLSGPELEMKYFAALLRSRASWTADSKRAVTITARCDGNSCNGDGEWRPPDIAGFQCVDERRSPACRTWVGHVTLSATTASVHSEHVREVWEHVVERYRFHYTCRELAEQIERTRARGVGDCTALTKLLVALLRSEGHDARPRLGYVLSGFSTRKHSWAQVNDDDGHWKDLDITWAVMSKNFLTAELGSFSFGSRLSRLMVCRPGGSLLVEHICGKDGIPTTISPNIEFAPLE